MPTIAALTGHEPELVCTVRDDSLGLLGHVVIDASIGGHACGGLRLSKTVCVEELRNLARSMTLKYGFNCMAQGGAKAGIVGDPDMPVDAKRRLLFRFGQMIAPLLRGGSYYSGPDMNTNEEDVEHMLNGAGVHLPAPRKGRGKKSGLYTAMAVMIAAEAAASAMHTSLEGKTIAIEGFGAVGSAFALLMNKKKKAKVVAISTTQGAIYNPEGLNVEKLLELKARHGNSLVHAYTDADKIGNEDLLLLNVDILSPCARQFPITVENASMIRASLVCPGANNPVTREGEEVLFRRNIVSIPHFVSNCGGVLGNKVEVLGMGEDFIESFIRQRNFQRICSLIARAREQAVPMTLLAESEAMAAFVRMRQDAERANLSSFTHRLGLRVFNAGVVPDFMVRPLAPRYLRRFMKTPQV